MIQIAERPILQQAQNITQPKVRPKTSQSSMIPKTSYTQDKVIPVHYYITPQEVLR